MSVLVRVLLVGQNNPAARSEKLTPPAMAIYRTPEPLLAAVDLDGDGFDDLLGSLCTTPDRARQVGAESDARRTDEAML